MPPVPGRSKGCHTCRRRRIKCDEVRPTCQRCRKAGHECDGYKRPLEFRNAFPATFSSLHVSAERRSDNKVVPRVQSNRSDDDDGAIDIFTSRPPPPELSLVAFREDLYSTFLIDNFVWRTYGTPWLELAVRGKLGQLSLDASRALSQTNFGGVHHQAEIKVNGLVQYSKALKEVALHLSHPERPGLEELLVPVMMLLIHASSQGDRQGSISHFRGLAQLLLVCGPERFQREPLRQAFDSCRATLITTGLITRQRSFLETEEWQTIPWALDPPAQSSQSKLLDILAFVPGFLEDETRLNQTSNLVARQKLIDCLYDQLKRAFEWRWQWENDTNHKAWDAHSSQQGLSRQAIQSPTLQSCVDIMTYNAVLLWLVGLLRQLDPLSLQVNSLRIAHCAQSPFHEQPYSHRCCSLHLPGETTQLTDFAIEICKAFDFLARNIKGRVVSSLFFLMPIGLAWGVLEHEESDWKAFINKTLTNSYVTRGYPTGQNVFGFGSYARPTLSSQLDDSKRPPPVTLWRSHTVKSTELFTAEEIVA